MRFILNDTLIDSGHPPGTTVLDYVRSVAGLKGTKEACREGDCGACLVLVGRLEDGMPRYRAVTSCLLPLAEVEGCHLVTVEGLNQGRLTPVQQAMVDEGAVQCGFCTPGIVVALSGFFLASANLSLADGVAAVEGNICRCTGYVSIRRVLHRLCADVAPGLDRAPDRIAALIDAGLLPPYFAGIATRLAELPPPPPGPVPRPEQRIVAGGTDLYVQQPEELEDLADEELFLASRAQLAGIWRQDGQLYIGGAATVEELRVEPAMHELVSDLERFIRLVSSQPIRHRATIAGNIVNASPIGDLTILFLALDAELGLGAGDATRTLALRRFFTGYKQLALQPGELVRWVRIPLREPPPRFNFEKVSKRTHLDIATVNSAASIASNGDTISEAHLAAGGVAPIPLYLERTSAFLRGAPISAETARQAAATAVAETSPIDDVRGSADYRRLLVRQLVFAHFHALFGLEEGLP